MQPTTDTTAFRSMYDRYFDDVARYCLRRLPREDAHDAVADVFLVAWRRANAMPDGDGALPWLYAVARNVVRNFERSSRRSRRLTAKLGAQPRRPASSAELHVIRRADYEAVVCALDRLRPADQEVVRLRAMEGLTTAQIAATLGCSDAAAKKRVTRALGRLRNAAGLVETATPATAPRAIDKGGER